MLTGTADDIARRSTCPPGQLTLPDRAAVPALNPSASRIGFGAKTLAPRPPGGIADCVSRPSWLGVRFGRKLHEWRRVATAHANLPSSRRTKVPNSRFIRFWPGEVQITVHGQSNSTEYWHFDTGKHRRTSTTSFDAASWLALLTTGEYIADFPPNW